MFREWNFPLYPEPCSCLELHLRCSRHHLALFVAILYWYNTTKALLIRRCEFHRSDNQSFYIGDVFPTEIVSDPTGNAPYFSA